MDQILAQYAKSVADTALLYTGLKQNLNSSLPLGLVVSFAAIIGMITKHLVNGRETLYYNPDSGFERDNLDRQCSNFAHSGQVSVCSLLI